jgi:chromosome segregation ATPase
MREGYMLLKSIETLQNELRPINTDEDNQILDELIKHYHEQLKSCDSSYVETITTLRQIQMNINKFDHSCKDIEHTIKQQQALFEQFIDNNQNILPENLNQQIQVLKTLQKEIQTKTDSMIDTLKLTTQETPIGEIKIERLINDNEHLKSEILVSLKSVL